MKGKKTNVYRMMTLMLFFCMSGFLTRNTQAQPLQHQTTRAESSLQVSFLGVENGFLVFRVVSTNPYEQRSTLTIYDHGNRELFKENIKTQVFAKRMLFYPGDVESVTFRLITDGKEVKKVFTVEQKLTETLQVKEVENK